MRIANILWFRLINTLIKKFFEKLLSEVEEVEEGEVLFHWSVHFMNKEWKEIHFNQ